MDTPVRDAEREREAQNGNEPFVKTTLRANLEPESPEGARPREHGVQGHSNSNGI